MKIMKKISLFIFALISMFAFTFGVSALDVNDEASLREALSKGGDVKLTENITTSTKRIIIDKDVNLDLNGKTLTSLIDVTSNKTLTISSSVEGGKFVALANEYSDEEKKDVKTYYAIGADNAKVIVNSGDVSSNDTQYGFYALNGGTIIINGGNHTTGNAVLSGNNTTGAMSFVVNGGTLTTKYGPAIYMAGPIDLTITKGTINGGISLRMGIVNISGGVINAATTSLDSPKEYFFYSGNAWFADALYVYGGTYTTDIKGQTNKLELNITGGTFNVANGQGSPIAIYDLGKVEQVMNVKVSGAKLTTDATTRTSFDVINLKDLGLVNDASETYTCDKTKCKAGGQTSTSTYGVYSNKHILTTSNGTYTLKPNVKAETDGVKFESNDAFSTEYTLVVAPKTEKEVKDVTTKLTEAYKDNKKVAGLKLISLHEINIVDGNDEVVPMENGKYTISIPVAEDLRNFKNYKVIYVTEAGEIQETIDAKLVNGKVVFTTTHLSTYGVIGYNNPTTNPETSDNIVTYAVILCASIFALGSAVALRKRYN